MTRLENWASDCGALIVGHGTRDPEGVAGFVETVQQVRAAIEGLKQGKPKGK